MTVDNPFRANRMIDMIHAGFVLQEVGDHFGVSRERVRQIYKKVTGNPTPQRVPSRDKGSVAIRRFWARCRVTEDGCWVWEGYTNPVTGYGSCGPKAYGDQYAHRSAYMMTKGPIPKGLTLDHLCRVRACINPAHLEAVTQRENTLRSPTARAALNARKTHCPKGHPYSIVRSDGCRDCRICTNERARERTARNRAIREGTAA